MWFSSLALGLLLVWVWKVGVHEGLGVGRVGRDFVPLPAAVVGWWVTVAGVAEAAAEFGEDAFVAHFVRGWVGAIGVLGGDEQKGEVCEREGD